MLKSKLKGSGAFSASVLLAASALIAAPAAAAKPSPPPPPPPDPTEVCFPWGSTVYGVDCCPIYPQLCEGQAPEERGAAIKPE